MRILVTGTAGFIGYHLVKRLQPEGYEIVGLDNINDFYEVNLKLDRLRQSGIETDTVTTGRAVLSNTGWDQRSSQQPLSGSESGKNFGVSGTENDLYGTLLQSSIYNNYRFVKLDLNDRDKIEALFEEEQFDAVIHLAAQAGVRYSLENPAAYIDSNISGFLNILEGCRHTNVKHLVYASSSSVYGTNIEMPFKTSDRVDKPISLYAASKKSNELMAHTYSHLFGLPTTGLRFFTVYGPWGRPDMALFLFTKAIVEGKPINVYNYGKMERDFTYVDDIVEGVARLLLKPPAGDETLNAKRRDGTRQAGTEVEKGSGSKGQGGQAPYQLFNIGHGSPVKLMDFIYEIEKCLGIEAEKNMIENQPGDVLRTWADVEDLSEKTGYRPRISIEEGIRRFVEWYKGYYKVADK